MLSFSPKYSLLPVAVFLLLAAFALCLAFALQRVPFTGANTMIFAASCTIAAMSICSDYRAPRKINHLEAEGAQQKTGSLPPALE